MSEAYNNDMSYRPKRFKNFVPEEDTTAYTDSINLSDIDFSLSDDIFTAEEKKAEEKPLIAEAVPKRQAVTFEKAQAVSPKPEIIPEVHEAVHEEESLEDVISEIDFNLENSITFDIKDVSAMRQKGSSVFEYSSEKEKSFLEKALRYFTIMKTEYVKRDSNILDADSFSKLRATPVFILGLFAGFFFYMVLKIFAEIDVGMEGLIVLVLICAGVMPSAVIIPNSVRYGKKFHEAQELNDILRRYYIDSDFQEIPYEMTNPYIIEELISISKEEKTDNISYILEKFIGEFSGKKEMANAKKQADTSDNNEVAAGYAAVFVVLSRLLDDYIR